MLGLFSFTTFPTPPPDKETFQVEQLQLQQLSQVRQGSEIQIVLDVKKFTEGTKEIPVEIINVPKNISLKYFPKSIYISYYTSLENFNAIKKNDFRLICNYKDLKENSTFLTPVLTKTSEKAKSVRLHHEKVEFIITE